MAVNYGLGTENAGGACFGTAYKNIPQVITITALDTPVPISDLDFGIIGTGAGTQFDYTNHNIIIDDLGRIKVKTTGMYLISYSITSSGATNDNLTFSIKKNGTENIYLTTQSYSRGGDMFESGASGIVFLHINDYIVPTIANQSHITNVTIDTINISLAKIGKGGELDA